MLLTCPACSTRYTVSAAAIGPSGRTVRCAACGHSWFQGPEEGMVSEAPPPKAATPPPPPPPEPKTPHASFREKAQARERVARLSAAGMAWAATGLVFAAALGVAVWKRADIVAAAPRTASAFAAIGLPVNATGLEIEGAYVQFNKETTPPSLTVSGVIRNVSTDQRPLPLVRVSLRDEKDAEVLAWTVDLGRPTLAPGGKAPFLSELPDPPGTASTATFDFASSAIAMPARRVAAAQPKPTPTSAPSPAAPPADPAHAETAHAADGHAAADHAGEHH
jgi:predicted Zn finger-like uncharacterized protein